MKELWRNRSGQIHIVGLGLLLLFVGIVLVVFRMTPLAKMIFGIGGQLSEQYLYIGIGLIIVGLILGQRGMKKM